MSYTVKDGDTLWEIAEEKLGNPLRWTEIAQLNGITTDPNKCYIYTGDTLKMPDDSPSSGGGGSYVPSTPKPTTISKYAKLEFLCPLAGSQREMFAAWSWDQKNTENYEVKWVYGTGQGFEVIGSKTTTDEKQCTYSAPENAEYVGVYVKPISKKRSSSSNSYYWTAEWSTKMTYYFSNNPPETPPVPTVEINKYSLKAYVENLDINAKKIEFQIVQDDEKVFKTGTAEIKTARASYLIGVTAGHEYKVRCRGVRDKTYGEWSEYSANYGTAPAASKGIKAIRALSESSVYLDWSIVSNAKSYVIEYTSDKNYFDSSNQTQTMTVEYVVNHAEILGLESGKEWFFRVKAVNDSGESSWTSIRSVKIGTVPSAPTTWSSATTGTIGNPMTLYWIHNSEDGSDQREAELELTIGSDVITHVIYSADCPSIPENGDKTAELPGFVLRKNTIVKIKMRYANKIAAPTLNVNETGAISISASDPDDILWRAGDVIVFMYNGVNWTILETDAEMNMTSFTVNTSLYSEGFKLLWRVRTKGVIDAYGSWSVQRTIDMYAPPTLMLSVTNTDGERIDKLTSLPFYVAGIPGPNTQTPTGYSLSIIANEAYETMDNIGNVKMVKVGDEVYSNYFDTQDSLLIEFSANNISLENNITYTVMVVVSMNSGLTAESSVNFTVAWEGDICWPNLEIEYDPETYTTHLRPHCEDVNGVPIEGYLLAVYRREFDGGFTELASGLVNVEQTFITDPHPALDYARYRVVATQITTGQVSYYDVPGFPIGETSAIIQWDETWSYLADNVEIPYEQPSWSGSLLKLKYNVDVAPKYDPDVTLTEYIGRKHPVGYYGTQLGETATWSAEIDKEDTETLYALRRLAIWMGDVYVREPSGSGYWANVNVSFPQKHLSLTIPVTLEIARVEGGV